MAIQLEWRCLAHGEFTSPAAKGGKIPKCPRGCSAKFVVQEIRSAPAFKSGGTAKVDGIARQLASDFNMSDIPTAHEGESVMQLLRKKPQYQPTWGEVPHAQPGFSRDPSIAVPTYSPAAAGCAPGVSVPAITKELKWPTTVVAGVHKATVPGT